MVFYPDVVRSDCKIFVYVFCATNLHCIFSVISRVSYHYIIGAFLIPLPRDQDVNIQKRRTCHTYVPKTLDIVW